MDKFRVLVIAEAANPDWVSVPLVGWNHALALSKVADTHLVTQVRNKSAIEAFGWVDGREFTAIDSEAVARTGYKLASLLRGGSGKGWTVVTALSTPSYLYFEHLLWKQFSSKLRNRDYDIVHRVTPLSPTTPSFLGSKLSKLGIPLVVGPLNGGVPWPKQFDGARRAENEWLSYLRDAYRLLPGYRNIRKHSTALVVGSGDTEAQMPDWCRDRLYYQPENAVDPARFSLDTAPSAETGSPGPLKIAFVGRLVPYKGADMLLEAVAPLIRAGTARLEIIGDGPERSRLEKLATDEKLGTGVEFLGWVPQDALSKTLKKADVLGFPSIREFGGGVVLEAMALGVVPVVAAYGGPKELVTAETGVAIALAKRETMVHELRRVFQTLCTDRERVSRLGQAARARVAAHFTWEAKAQQTLSIYAWLLGKGPDPRPALNAMRGSTLA